MLNKKREDEFNELMATFDNEIEAIAGQPDPECKKIKVGEKLVDGNLKPVYAGDWKRQEPTTEKIKNPNHYKFFGKDSMPILERVLSTEELIGFWKGNALKYRLRAAKKPGNSVEQDIKKAMYYESLYDEFVKQNTP